MMDSSTEIEAAESPALATTTTVTTTAAIQINEKEENNMNAIFQNLAVNPKIQFRSQQINDPEISTNEKFTIAGKIFQENHQKFFLKFGQYLTTEQLKYFQNTRILDKAKEENYEIQYILNDLLIKRMKYQKCIKNRRYAALKNLLKVDYFTEKEMMKREPHLYEQYIGQYLTDNEKLLRDGGLNSSEDDTPFSKVLLDGIERDQIEKLRIAQSNMEPEPVTTTTTTTSNVANDEICCPQDENMYPRIPSEYRKHWGDFDDDDKQISNKILVNSSTSSMVGELSNNSKKQEYITGDERQMLRDDFIELMHLKFLHGEDPEFDYNTVDDNSDLDDMEQLNQDKEDEYFKEDDDDEEDIQIATTSKHSNNVADDDDELEIFMKQLAQDHNLE